MSNSISVTFIDGTAGGARSAHTAEVGTPIADFVRARVNTKVGVTVRVINADNSIGPVLAENAALADLTATFPAIDPEARVRISVTPIKVENGTPQSR